jgi:hypothetical protein
VEKGEPKIVRIPLETIRCDYIVVDEGLWKRENLRLLEYLSKLYAVIV